MKCRACDVILTPRESVRRVKSSNEYLDLCDHCYNTIAEDVVTYTYNPIFGDYQEGGPPPPIPAADDTLDAL